MGRRRKGKKKGRGRDPRGGGRRADPSPGLLDKAIHRGRSGDPRGAERLARRSYQNAGSPGERREAGRVLAEALLHVALELGNPALAAPVLDEALRFDPDSPRLRLHRAVTNCQIDPQGDGRGISEELFAHGAPVLDSASVAYARELSRLLSGEPWDSAALAEEDADELRLVERLLRPDGASLEKGRPGAPSSQLTLLPLHPGADVPRPAAGRERSSHSRRMWEGLLALQEGDGPRAAAALQAVHSRRESEPGAPRLRYYLGVAAFLQGDGEESLASWTAARDGRLDTPWLGRNLAALLRRRTQEAARKGEWREVVRLAGEPAMELGDRILAEIVALAHEHLGYEAAQAARWPEAARQWSRAMHLHPRRATAQNLALASEALERWDEAAEAWRAMARRRPRKRDHPDYMSDDQVAELWFHAAECYRKGEELDEALTCVDTALKYAPGDARLQLERADILLERGSVEAAERELDRLLEGDPGHLEALRIRAALEGTKPWGDAIPYWRRVLEREPRDPDAREGLAASYVRRVERMEILSSRPPTQAELDERTALLENGLGELPDHPALLIALGGLYRDAGQPSKSRDRLLAAIEHTAGNPELMGSILHTLLHVVSDTRDEDMVRVLQRVRELPRLLPGFWLDQAERVLDCELPTVWFHRFLDEALALVGGARAADSIPAVLCSAFEVATLSRADEVAGAVQRRIRREVPDSGAVELTEAWSALYQGAEPQTVRPLFRTAKERARARGDDALLKMIEEEESFHLANASQLLRRLLNELGL